MNKQRADEKNRALEEVEKLKKSIVTNLSNTAEKKVEKELKNIFNSSSSRAKSYTKNAAKSNAKVTDNSAIRSIKIILVIVIAVFAINYILNEGSVNNLESKSKDTQNTQRMQNANTAKDNNLIANDIASKEKLNETATVASNERVNNTTNNITENKNSGNIPNTNNNTVNGIVPNGRVDAKVIRVVDGDTLVVTIEDKKYKVRLVGVDTPESVSPKKEKNTKQGKIASDYTKKNLEGKDIILEFDVSPYDRYGRLLAYVYVDGICYNEKLLEEGYAKVMMISPNVKNSKYYKTIEKQARENNVGFWNGFFK